ncbi:hypothetical protein E5288_WYG010801 [Bos mutus]|uniref:Uncharacterized protein n=1 Tax=Bos mutus TaxID=72004 RepID=A0A6B0S6N4_9CETA|nr:hypothetical protein [Bos mutus]
MAVESKEMLNRGRSGGEYRCCCDGSLCRGTPGAHVGRRHPVATKGAPGRCGLRGSRRNGGLVVVTKPLGILSTSQIQTCPYLRLRRHGRRYAGFPDPVKRWWEGRHL